MLSILDKNLYRDIPFFLASILDGNLRLMKVITGTLTNTSIPHLQVRSLCTDRAIGAEKPYQLLEVMQEVGIIFIRKEHDSKAKTAGEKLLFSDPAFYSVLAGDLRNAREALVAMLCYGGYDGGGTKDETTGDFVLSKSIGTPIRHIKIEVGFSSKSSKKADFVIRDDIDYPVGKNIPLWLLGMMY